MIGNKKKLIKMKILKSVYKLWQLYGYTNKSDG